MKKGIFLLVALNVLLLLSPMAFISPPDYDLPYEN